MMDKRNIGNDGKNDDNRGADNHGKKQEGIDLARTLMCEPYSEAINSQGWYAKKNYKDDVHQKIDNHGFMTERLARENAYYTNNYMNLRELKIGLIENNPEIKKVDINYFFDSPYTKNKYEKYLYYLHFLIIYSTYRDVDRFLYKYFQEYGKDNIMMFINYPLVCHFSKNIITPLMCAMLWCSEPQMIRVLYSWGADVSITDVNNNYCENIYSGHHYYYNHLHPFLISRHVVLGVRDLRDFAAIKKEMKYLSKEATPKKEEKWSFPAMKI